MRHVCSLLATRKISRTEERDISTRRTRKFDLQVALRKSSANFAGWGYGWPNHLRRWMSCDSPRHNPLLANLQRNFALLCRCRYVCMVMRANSQKHNAAQLMYISETPHCCKPGFVHIVGNDLWSHRSPVQRPSSAVSTHNNGTVRACFSYNTSTAIPYFSKHKGEEELLYSSSVLVSDGNSWTESTRRSADRVGED